MSTVSLNVNGRARRAEVEPDSPLLYVLRDSLGFSNPRFGCGLGQCGACTVLVNGDAVRSCTLPVSSAIGKTIVTLDGLGTPERPHPVQQAFIDEQAFQCGYCMNGWVLVSKVLLDRNPSPTDQEIRRGLDGLICRCGSHVAILAAVRRAADATNKGSRA
ncbi:MAG TPA: (2Fe-2S)-binding protein [Vicinamibacterales bacterium]|nr:(2Fe-2S)-binding protein [Vicinamibacterales bacterium]